MKKIFIILFVFINAISIYGQASINSTGLRRGNEINKNQLILNKIFIKS